MSFEDDPYGMEQRNTKSMGSAVIIILVICLIYFLTACEPQRAIARHIYCDDKLLGVTLVPEGSFGYGPWTINGGMKMAFIDIKTKRETIVHIGGCKKVEIHERIMGAWGKR